MVKIFNPYGGGQDQIADAIIGAAERGLGMGIKREELRSRRYTNDTTAAVEARMRELGAEKALLDPTYQGYMAGLNPDVANSLLLQRNAVVRNTANPYEGETIARAIVGSGGSASTTPMQVSRELAETVRNNNMSSADRRYGVDQGIAQQRYEFDNKPIEAMAPKIGPDPAAIGPFMPGMQPQAVTGYEPGFVPQGSAVAMGAQPIIKNGMTITTNPDGTTTVTQGGVAGGVAGGKPTEQQIRASGIAQEMAPGIAILNQVFDQGATMSRPGLLASTISKNPAWTDAMQQAGVINDSDQMILGSMMSIMNNLYIKTGAARTASEDINELIGMVPLQSDNPQQRQLKRAMFNQKAMGVIMASRDPVVRQQMMDAMSGMFTGPQPGAQPLQFNPQAPAAAQSPISNEPVRVNTPQEAMSLPSGTKFITPDGRVKVRP